MRRLMKAHYSTTVVLKREKEEAKALKKQHIRLRGLPRRQGLEEKAKLEEERASRIGRFCHGSIMMCR
jgi:hypothetical protein